jgi:hypothetical protein
MTGNTCEGASQLPGDSVCVQLIRLAAILLEMRGSKHGRIDGNRAR